MNQELLISKLTERMAAFKDGALRDELAAASAVQKHLDRGTPERTYWHYGYAVALLDVISLIQGKPGNFN